MFTQRELVLQSALDRQLTLSDSVNNLCHFESTPRSRIHVFFVLRKHLHGIKHCPCWSRWYSTNTVTLWHRTRGRTTMQRRTRARIILRENIPGGLRHIAETWNRKNCCKWMNKLENWIRIIIFINYVGNLI